MMKHFIKKIFMFIVGIILICVAVFVLFFHKKNHISLDESITTIITGDSRTQCGLNDAIVENSINVSQSSEHFLYSYNVLRLLLKNNKQIEQIILGVSFHSFSNFYDEFIKESDQTIFMFPKYYSILNYESLQDVSLINFAELKVLFKNMLRTIFSSSMSDYSFIGSFYRRDRCDLSDSITNKTIQNHFYTATGSSQHFAKYQREYLFKIIELCDNKGVQLILLNTPIHYSYYERIPEKFIFNYYCIIEDVVMNSNVLFWDLSSFVLDDKCYADGHHLNPNGANIFSIIINVKMKKL